MENRSSVAWIADIGKIMFLFCSHRRYNETVIARSHRASTDARLSTGDVAIQRS